MMRTDPDKPPIDPPEHVTQAQRLAKSVGACIVQANWPNALHRPEECEHTGRSAVIAPDGELLFRLPAQAPGVAVFDLGARRFDWFASEKNFYAKAPAEARETGLRAALSSAFSAHLLRLQPLRAAALSAAA